MWLNLWKPTTYTQWQKLFSSLIDSSINKLITHHYTTAKRWLVCFCFLGLSDVHKCSAVHWMPLVGLYRHYLADNHHLTLSRCKPWIYIYFVTFWVQWGHILGHFTLKIVELLYNLPFYGYLLPPTFQPHISACGVDKNNQKWQEIQLAVCRKVGNLIAIQ